MVVKSSCEIACLAGEIVCMGATVTQGKSLRVDINEKMPFLELRSTFGGSGDGPAGRETSKVLATECFVPPLELEAGYYHGEIESTNSTIVFGREFVEKIALLRTALSFTGPALKSVLVVGERKCGKSTLCNYLSHQLTSASDVYLLDVDCGQPFDSMPGFIHLRKVTNRQVANSTTWTGGKIPAECIWMRFVGDYSSEFFPSLWMAKVEELLQYTKEKKLKGTLIVNTGGLAKGYGMQSLQSLVLLFQPQAIAEISVRGDSIVRHLPQNRLFNFISNTGDFINSKISVFTFYPIVPENLRESFTSMKESRNTALWRYFEDHTISHPIKCSQISLRLLEKDQKRIVGLEGVNLELVGLMLVGSICSIETIKGSEIPILIEDLDKEKGQLIIRIQSDYLFQLPEDTLNITKSEFLHVDHTSRTNKEDWQEEIEAWGKLGQKVFWSGPLLGVGSRPLRRKVSSRKK